MTLQSSILFVFFISTLLFVNNKLFSTFLNYCAVTIVICDISFLSHHFCLPSQTCPSHSSKIDLKYFTSDLVMPFLIPSVIDGSIMLRIKQIFQQILEFLADSSQTLDPESSLNEAVIIHSQQQFTRP